MGDPSPTLTTPSTNTTSTLTITVDFTGGLEMLFSNIPRYKLTIPRTNASGKPFTLGNLVPWLCENVMKDSRKELFVIEEAVRPGILVLINEADWELEGEDKYELEDGDNVLFVSTLHGG